MRKLMIISLMLCVALAACHEDHDTDAPGYAGGSSKRIKRITGENSVWGKYCLVFNYEPDGTLKDGWRTDVETGDTTGAVRVSYDADYYLLSFVDFVPGVDADSAAVLKEMYPDTWADTLLARRTEQVLCSVEQRGDRQTKSFNRPRRDIGSGKAYDPTYVRVSYSTQIADLTDGKPVVIRSLDYVYGSGADNDATERTVSKYEFAYDGSELVGGSCYSPDLYNETGWKKKEEIGFASYSGIVTGVESDTYKMRRSTNRVAVAEPGNTLTYTLDEEGLAVRLETSDGEQAVFEYEAGSGNFYELFAMPLERVLGKVWVR